MVIGWTGVTWVFLKSLVIAELALIQAICPASTEDTEGVNHILRTQDSSIVWQFRIKG